MPSRESQFPYAQAFSGDRLQQTDREEKLNSRVFELENELRRLKDGISFVTGHGGPRILRDAAEHWYAKYRAAREHIIEFEGFPAEAIDGIIATRTVMRTDADERDKPLTAITAYLGEHL